MSEEGQIRIIDDKRQILAAILLSLESSRPSKSETDILDALAKHFELPPDKKLWADILVSKGESVDTVLDVIFEELRPFVQMMLEIYRFLSKLVSTTGGRTTHFEISTDDRRYKLKFPNVDFPKRVKWIEQWMLIQNRLVTIDWPRISNLLIFDNGTFYGTVDGKMLIQSLIFARRVGNLSPNTEAVAREFYELLRSTLKTWWNGYLSDDMFKGGSDRRVGAIQISPLFEEFQSIGVIKRNQKENSLIGIDIDCALQTGSYSIEDVFTGFSDVNVDVNSRDTDPATFISPALFFVALWGLDDPSFQRVVDAAKPRLHKDSGLFASELESKSKELGEELISKIKSTIISTGEIEESEQQVRRKIEILLLPYWKDRWFLYEVWSLTLPLLEAISVGARVELIGVEPISNEGIEGTNWNLPTQKAREPVARLSQLQGNELLVWFQRETKTETGHIEPDIRITKSDDRYDDLLILECKDRVKFGTSSAEGVARNYLDGSSASTVWIVDYEDAPAKGQKQSDLSYIDGRQIGIAYNFKPESGNTMVKASIRALFKTELPQPKPSFYLVIDISGSMSDKLLPNLDEFRRGGDRFTSEVYLWQDSVRQIGWERLSGISSIKDLAFNGAENAQALREFAATLPSGSRLVVVTDSSGKDTIDRGFLNSAPDDDAEISGHPVDFVII